MALGTVTGTVDNTDINPTGLGRWASVRMTGRGGKKVRIVSAYNPNKTSGRKYKPDTVYSQQKRFFLKNNRAGCPRELFIEDIIKEITAWNKNNEQIILCIDLNEDFTRENGPLYSALKEVGLINVLTNKHPDLPPPATQDTGSRPIDAIMVTPMLTQIERGGWLQFGASVGDHRPAFIDVNLKMLIEKNKYEIATPKARRLQVGNYNSLKKYLRYVEGQFRKENLLAKVLGITKRIMNKEKVDVYEIEMLDKKGRKLYSKQKNIVGR